MESVEKKGGIPTWCIVLIVFLLFIIIILFCVVSFFLGREFAPKNNEIKQPIAITATQKPQVIYPDKTQQPTPTQNPTLPQNSEPEALPVHPVNINAEKTKVVDYFSQMDLIAQENKQFDDPNTFAMEMAQGVVSGNFSSLDSLVSSLDDIIAKAKQLSAPTDCVEHKKASIEVLEKSKDMLLIIRESIVNGDMAALASIQMKGEESKLKAEQINEMEKKIKAKYGIN